MLANFSYHCMRCLFSPARAEPRKQFAFTYFSMLCTAVPCAGPISLPANSTFANGSKPVTLQFGMKFFVTCEKGFVKDGGGEEVKCGAGGQWKWTLGKLSCKEIVSTSPTPSLKGKARFTERMWIGSVQSHIRSDWHRFWICFTSVR